MTLAVPLVSINVVELTYVWGRCILSKTENIGARQEGRTQRRSIENDREIWFSTPIIFFPASLSLC